MGFILKLQNIDDIMTEMQLDYLVNTARQNGTIDTIQVSAAQKEYIKHFRYFGINGKAIFINVIDAGNIVGDVDLSTTYKGIQVDVV